MFNIGINDKTAWVTGASRGIGRSIALALAKAGCDVAIGFRSKEAEARQVAEQIEELGRKAITVQMDISNLQDCKNAHSTIQEKLGPVSILVNNAGMIKDGLLLMLEPEDFEEVLRTNVLGVVHVTKTCVRDMMQQRFGRIINLSSVAATKGGRGQANYAASKGAIEAMTRSIACELATKKITANCIAPGVIETDMSEEVRRLAKDEILSRQLIKRFGTPDEVAAWAVFLASDYGSFITGQVIHIDGGLKMA